MEVAALAIGIAALIVAAVGLFLGAMAYIDVKALKNSTHQIQYVPIKPEDLDPMTGKTDKELSKELREVGAMSEPFDDEDNLTLL